MRFLDENYGGDFGLVNSSELYNKVKAANPNMDRFVHASDLSDMVEQIRPAPEGYRLGGLVKMAQGGAVNLDDMRYELMMRNNYA